MKVYWFSTTKIIQITIVSMLVLISAFYSYTQKDAALSVFLVEKRELPIYSVETNEKKVAISFDAAWGIEFTEDILRILRERDIKPVLPVNYIKDGGLTPNFSYRHNCFLVISPKRGLEPGCTKLSMISSSSKSSCIV